MTDKNETVGVVLFQLGGPDSYDAVEPFLYNLFMDPFIIDIPLGFLLRKPLSKFISKRRSVGVIEDYKTMGQPSPITDITEKQANALRAALNQQDPDRDYKTFIAMRYWHPLTKETVRHVLEAEVDRLILLPLYPQYSKTTSGSSLYEWNRQSKNTPVADIPTTVIESYHDDPQYIDSVVHCVKRAIDRHFASSENLHLLFSAHGVPLKVIKNGDPYQHHIETTVKLVMERLSTAYPHYLSYQSKVGPQKWLEPSTIDMLEQLGANGVKDLLVVPIAFVSDHLETLYELDIEDREIAEGGGIENYHVMEGINDTPVFIRALSSLIQREVQQ